MTEDSYPTGSTARTTQSNCLKAAGITCLIVVIVGLALVIWTVTLVTRNPAIKRAYNQSKLVVQCQMNLQEIGGALERYSKRNGQYPGTLDELYPSFITKKEILHCPSDPRPKNTVSYEYHQPAMDAPGSFTVVECKRHVVVEGQPPWTISLFKDGRVTKHGYEQRGIPKPR